MFSCFYPDRIEESVYNIDFEKLYNNGKRGILFDIDNTLVSMEPTQTKPQRICLGGFICLVLKHALYLIMMKKESKDLIRISELLCI